MDTSPPDTADVSPLTTQLLPLLSKPAIQAHNYFKAKISSNAPAWQTELAHLTQLLLLYKDDKDVKTWLSILCFGLKPKLRIQELAKTSKSRICGKVFKEGDIAYTCLQCQVDDMCCQCADCFRKSDHQGHDYRAFQVGEGGCCDCGDAEAWSTDGFCKDHTGVSENDDPTANMPASLQEVVGIVASSAFKLVTKVLSNTEKHCMYPQTLLPSKKELRKPCATVVLNDDTHSFDDVIEVFQAAVPECPEEDAAEFAQRIDALGETVVFMGTKEECEKCAAEIGKIGIGTRVDEGWTLCFDLTVLNVLEWMDEMCGAHDGLNRVIGRATMRNILDTEDSPSTLRVFLTSVRSTHAGDMLDEMHSLLFQLIKDPEFKSVFAVEFLQLYKSLITAFVRSVIDWDSSLLTFAVQILTLPILTFQLAKNHNLLETLFEVTHHAINMTMELTHAPVALSDGRFDASAYLVASGRLNEILHVLEYVMGLKECAQMFLAKEELVSSFMKMLSYDQFINAEVRKTGEAVTMESRYWIIGLELALKLYAVFPNILKHLESESHYRTLMNLTYNALVEFFKSAEASLNVARVLDTSFGPFVCHEFDVKSGSSSFHLPLQRFYAELVLHGVRTDPRSSLTEIITAFTSAEVSQTSDFVSKLMEHPLRLMVLLGQERIGLWVRNGDSIHGQCSNYKMKWFRSSFYERDLVVIQCAAAILAPDHFVTTLLNRFNLLDFLHPSKDLSQYLTAFAEDASKASAERKKEIEALQDEARELVMMTEEFFGLILAVLKARNKIGPVDREQQIRTEVIHRLWLGRTPFSQLVKAIPQDLCSSEDLAPVVKQVGKIVQTSVKSSENAGVELKAEYKTQFDPFFAFYSHEARATALEKMRDDQELRAKNAKTEVSKLDYTPSPAPSPLFPAFQSITRLYGSRALHRALYMVLLRSAQTTPKLWSLMTLHQALHFIQMQIVELDAAKQPMEDSFCSLLEVHSDSAPSAIELLIQLSQLKETTELHPLLNWIFKKIAEMNNGKLKEATESSRDSARAKVDEQNAAEERKRKMMEAKARAMAQMQKKQSAFIQTHKSEIDESAMLKSSGTVATDVADLPTESGGTYQQEHDDVCIVCQEALGDPLKKCWGYISLAQRSTVDQIAAVEPEKRVEHFHRKVFRAQPLIQVAMCGHKIHLECYDKYYMASYTQSERQMLLAGVFLNMDLGEFTCPMCKGISNMVIPAVPRLAAQPQEDESFELPKKFGINFSSNPSSTAEDALMQAVNPTGAEPHPLRSALEGMATRLSCVIDDSEAPIDADPEYLQESIDAAVVGTLALFEIQSRKPNSPDSSYQFPFEFATALRPDKELKHLSWLLEASLAYSAVCRDPLGTAISKASVEKFNAALTGAQPESMLNAFLTADPVRTALRFLTTQSIGIDKNRNLSKKDFACLSVVALRSRITQALLWHKLQKKIEPYAPWIAASEKLQTNDEWEAIQVSLCELEKAIDATVAMPTLLKGIASDASICWQLASSLVPSLRRIGLLKSVSTGEKLPSHHSFSSIIDEFNAWSKYLCLGDSFAKDALPLIANCTEAVTAVEGYLKQLPHVIREANAKLPADSKKKPKAENSWSISIRSLAVSPPHAFSLPILPEEYNTLMQQHFQMACSNCANSTEPALCLVTGELLCAACQKSGVKEKGSMVGSCTLHSRRTGVGFGMYLLVRNAIVVGIRDGRAYMLAGPYVDQFGEEDPGLKRGKPLTLVEERMQQLKEVYMNLLIGVQNPKPLRAHRNYF